MNRGALRDGRSTSRARERAFLQVRTATACLFVFGVACLLLGAREAKADNICALGGSVPTGHIIYNITTSASCSGGGTLWQTRVPQNPDWACRPIGLNYPIPGGKIVTQVDLQRGACGAGAQSGTGWSIKDVANNDWMCAVWNQVTVPDGFVVTSVDENRLACDAGSTSTGYLLKTAVASGIWGCRSGTAAVWNLPTNYVITNIDNRTACTNGSSQLAWNIRIPSAANTLVCVPSPVPDGWVHTTDLQSFTACAPGASTGTGFRISPITDGGVTCSLTGIPLGFVIEDIKPSSVCGGTGYTVADLSIRTGDTYACLINSVPPPPTHIVVEADNYSRCAESGTGFGHKVALPVASGDWACRHPAAPVPSNFIVDQIDTNFGPCGAGASGGLADHILIPTPGNSYTVCGNSPVPTGFFYTGSGIKTQCNNSFGYDIGPAVPGAVACDPAQIPQQFVIVSISGPGQGLCSGNNYTIALPTTGGAVTNACYLSNTPSGFVWVGRTNFTACDAVVGLDYRMAEPDPTVGINTNICQGSPIPSGFVYTGYLSVGACEGSTAADATISVPDPNGSTVICNTANLPSGFVITSIDFYGQCGSTAGAVIGYPNATGQTLICDPSVPPPGYEVVQTGSYAACGAGGASGGGAIIRAADSGLMPTPFINPEPDVVSPPPAPAEQCPTIGGTPIVISAPKNTTKCNW